MQHATHPASSSPGAVARVAAALLLVGGACLVGGGAWLAGLGGSWYYLLAGIVLLVDAWLLWTGRPGGVFLFALAFAASLAWALWEAGLDWWPLAARMDVLFLLGFLLLFARRNTRWPWEARFGRTALGCVLGAFAVVAVATWLGDPHEISGTLASNTSVTAPGGMAAADWTSYGGSPFGQRYSALRQITPQNVDRLEPAWHFNTGDFRGRKGDPKETTFEVTPLKVGNRLFFCTPHQNVIALDATTGRQVWRYDPKIQDKLALQHLTCRGLSWQPPASAPAAAAAPAAPAASAPGVAPAQPGELPIAARDGPTDAQCASKLFMPTADGRLIALNPDNGHVCASFGGGTGQVNLWRNMPNYRPGAYYSTSPVVVTRKLVIVGGTVLDNVSIHEQSGVIRAFDIDTGDLVWAWDPGNPDRTGPLPPGETYTANSPNSWSISSVDEQLGLVYVPLGNQPPDQWGANRSPAVEKYSSSVVALDLATGAPRWVFQTVHHDLWDYDVPSQPSLLDLRVRGETVPVLVQPTKQGELFVLDRRTGQPVLPVREERAPQGAVEGDRTAPTQPRSAVSFDPVPLSGRHMWGATMFDQLYCRVAFHRLRYEGRFTPPSLQGSLVYPGNFGVFNWGSVAVDPARGWAFTTPAYLAFVSTLVPRPDATTLVVQGGGPPEGSLPALNENFGAPYAAKMLPFTSPLGIPCQQPPWGYVAGVDLGSGRIAWRHRNGTVRDLAPVPLPFRMGVPSLGGPLVTAGGVAFLSGTLDDYVRGYDMATGEELWRSRLPAGGQATPMTYEGSDGRQYLLVVAGGHGSLGTKAGDDVIAYALPR
ncbi:membrane-bound PQQ-dependent dehydrogenase, glucose/quinate/shikimate family [Ramlibacter sp. USB13]|uniref:Membrane-bound PQQ-dependent dehydrogenase, glucose/quinate/shikimate family n=1 Tax=Ramlibacter cellulosilyticus TaxID=2764187 RepID=A0A923SDL0_9BURK|nr:membrane-bound PQQ-dependent dehydrogenase, glucose/quinate/shikimate family [Ramlibacter cellulosilyticus]MBC5785443.1 membrane-bound PQQ-dependent dehydrogenase, glucose/quinate/shikimate family [Ramlibacter cellulosilyticus]